MRPNDTRTEGWFDGIGEEEGRNTHGMLHVKCCVLHVADFHGTLTRTTCSWCRCADGGFRCCLPPIDGCRASDGGRATLLLLDRADDPLSPLMHEFTYQCLVQDLLDIKVSTGERSWVMRWLNGSVREARGSSGVRTGSRGDS